MIPTSERIDLPPYANGWFQVAGSEELEPGGVIPLSYFGTEFVLFRTEDGTAHILDAYCPHLRGAPRPRRRRQGRVHRVPLPRLEVRRRRRLHRHPVCEQDPVQGPRRLLASGREERDDLRLA